MIILLNIKYLNEIPMCFNEDEITEIFYAVDEFSKKFEETLASYRIGNLPKKKPKMCMSEVMTIMIIFHGMQHKNIKHFYINYVQIHMKIYSLKLFHIIVLWN